VGRGRRPGPAVRRPPRGREERVARAVRLRRGPTTQRRTCSSSRACRRLSATSRWRHWPPACR
jgi:hypothetical protein